MEHDRVPAERTFPTLAETLTEYVTSTIDSALQYATQGSSYTTQEPSDSHLISDAASGSINDTSKASTRASNQWDEALTIRLEGDDAPIQNMLSFSPAGISFEGTFEGEFADDRAKPYIQAKIDALRKTFPKVDEWLDAVHSQRLGSVIFGEFTQRCSEAVYRRGNFGSHNANVKLLQTLFKAVLIAGTESEFWKGERQVGSARLFPNTDIFYTTEYLRFWLSKWLNVPEADLHLHQMFAPQEHLVLRHMIFAGHQNRQKELERRQRKRFADGEGSATQDDRKDALIDLSEENCSLALVSI